MSGSVRFDFEVYRGDIYAQTLNQQGGFNQVLKVSNLTDESRARLRFESKLKQLSRWSLNIQTGFEMVNNFDFKDSNARLNFLLGTQLILNFPGSK
jgi:hypothetical protein